MITNKTILNLKPCQDRRNNYLAHYKGKSHTYAQFLGLKHLTEADKLWVAVKLIPKAKLKFLSADIAELVLPIFEAQRPDDKRPRLAIDAIRTGVSGVKLNKVTHDANLAAYDSRFSTSYSTAVHASNAVIFALEGDPLYTSHAVVRSVTSALAQSKLEKKIRTIVLSYLEGGK